MNYSVDVLCGLFGKTRQAYYKKDNEVIKELVNNDLILTLVKEVRIKQKKLGGRKLLLKVINKLPQSQYIGRDAFFNLLRENNMLVRKRKTRVITTDSYHWLHKYPNLIKELVPIKPNILWVSDITYIWVGDEFMYLFLVTDAYSRKIIGWKLSETMEADNGLKALYMAISQLPAENKDLIHHSDRGVQYCSSKYVKCLQKHDIQISMTESGDPRENAIAERVNGILKVEWLYDMELKDKEEAVKAVGSIIDIYNTERPHLSVGMLTPDEAHQRTGELKKYWKTYKRKMKGELK
ncbi:MAG: IS3 family transposase [Bacteroidales bacterium]|nr:IS3 family transposase [Bacteroidales bacterium]